MTNSTDTLTHSEKYTPQHSPGFSERLGIIFTEVGIKPREYVALVSEFTNLTKIGARKMLNDDRPPSKIEAFNQLVTSLTKLLALKNKTVDDSVLAEYLLTGNKSPFVADFSLSEFYDKDPVLTSQIILKVEEIAKTNDIDTEKDIPKKDIRLIYYRIVNHCFKNNICSNFDEVEKQVLSLLILSKDNLL